MLKQLDIPFVNCEMIFKQRFCWYVFFWTGKKGNIASLPKNVKRKIFKIMYQFLYFGFAPMFWEELFLIKCLAFSSITNLSPLTSEVQTWSFLYQPTTVNYPQQFYVVYYWIRSKEHFLWLSKVYDKVWHEGLSKWNNAIFLVNCDTFNMIF